MKKKILALISLYVALIPIIGFNIYLRKIKVKTAIVTPKGKSFSVLSASTQYAPTQKVIYGFLPYWTLAETEYLHTYKLTDISYFALHVEKDGTIRKKLEDGSDHPGYLIWRESENLTELMEKGKKQGVRFSLTLISHEDDVTDAFLLCKSCWYTLIDELKTEMDYREIIDINLDFEYVEFPEEEIANAYSEFTKFINEELDKIYGESFVVVSTFADAFIKPRITKVQDLAYNADGIFIMAYDFHRPTSNNAGPVAPINGAPIHSEYDITTMLRDYLSYVSPGNLILGVPYYGYNWVTDSEKEYAERIVGDDDIGYSLSQTYADIMETKLEYHPEEKWSETGLVPYFTYISEKTGSNRTVYYENTQSLKIKYDLAKSKGLGGIGIWALGYDRGYQELWELLESEFIVN